MFTNTKEITYGLFVLAIGALSLSGNSLLAKRAQFDWSVQRSQMVDQALRPAGISDPKVIQSVLDTLRHLFVPKTHRKDSYLDIGIPIGSKQTISSPFIVAYMTQELKVKPTDKVLEIGTGSGYQAAILSPLVKEVYSIEIVEPLGKRAAKLLKKLKYKNIFTKIGDGYKGWAKHAPFDKIIVTCSPENIPQPLIDQLAEGGRIIIPVGERHQQTLYVLDKINGKMKRQPLRPTVFIAMTGTAEEKRAVLPDPARPKIVNGSFEAGVDSKGFVKGWFYQRNMSWEASKAEPKKNAKTNHYVQFKKSSPEQQAHLTQHFSIDGRKVPQIRFSARASFEKKNPRFHPDAFLWFFGDKHDGLGRAGNLGRVELGKAWTTRMRDIEVPVGARSAAVRIGIFGGSGTVRFDDIQIKKLKLSKKHL